MNESIDLDELQTLLMHLCERQVTLSDEALLCVMEAFNELSEVHAPAPFSRPPSTPPGDSLRRALVILDRLVQGSQRLEQTLALLRVKGLVDQATDRPG